MTEAYGQRLGEALRVENAPSIVTRALRTADIAVTEIRCDNPLPEMCGPLQREDAFLVTLHLRDSPNREYWEDGRRASVCALRAGESCLHDLTPHTDWPLPRCRAARHRLRFLYPGGRHEMLNEINRRQVQTRLLGWISRTLEKLNDDDRRVSMAPELQH